MILIISHQPCNILYICNALKYELTERKVRKQIVHHRLGAEGLQNRRIQARGIAVPQLHLQ